MSKIRILPEQLANRIAAGEVVERPASVVKELIENSLDAGAERIEIDIEGGGTRLIRIIDNGSGMDEDDVLLSLERHGTSKISVDDDLDHINTLGFRGEAIPSIGSVSKMTITSRPAGAPFGSRAELNYGKLSKVHEVGCPQGTTIEIRQLFGNTPARRKFLRTQRTELAHIDEVVKNYALAATRTTFILRINDRETLHLHSADDLKGRLREIMNYRGDFLEVNGTEKRPAWPHIQGLLLPPDASVAASARIRLLVNGRAVRDRLMAHAATEGMRGFLMKGRSPAGLLHLHLPSEEVDVNVHPAKQEIRFRNGQAIHQLISQSVEEAIREYQKTIQGRIFLNQQPETDSPPPARMMGHDAQPISLFEPPPSLLKPTPRTLGLSGPVFSGTEPDLSNKSQPAAEPLPVISSPTSCPEKHPVPKSLTTERTAHPVASVPPSQPLCPAPPHDFRESIPAPAIVHSHTLQEPVPQWTASPPPQPLRLIGQYNRLYILCQSGPDLLIIDQHAAHERLLFESLKEQYLGGRLASQALLFPIHLELSAADIRSLELHQESIQQLGFDLRPFGGSTYLLSGVPALAGHCSPSELLLDILAGLTPRTDHTDQAHRLDNILAGMACKAAVKSGDTLHEQEIEGLLKRMAKADLFSHCPHGRPVCRRLGPDEIKKWFHRT